MCHRLRRGAALVGFGTLTMVCTGLTMGQQDVQAQHAGIPVTQGDRAHAFLDCLTLRGWHRLVHGDRR